tara:strand:- start:7821 stop:9929 length:2109 start_codon:yes stop_codon:yes gene_type:complete
MKIKKLCIKNIRSYESEEIEFPDGSVLLAGDIGTGKTTLLLAIEYALFGLQPGQRGSALLRNEVDSGQVSLEIEVKGQEILIERGLKRSGKGISNESAAITIDGIREEASVTEIKTKVLQILGYPPEFIKKNNVLYRYTVFTPQEQMKQIVLEDPESRLNIIRHIFGIDKYKRIRENLSTILSTLKEEIKFLQGEISTLNDDKKRLEERIFSLKFLNSKIEEKEVELKKDKLVRKDTETKLKEFEEKIKEKQEIEREIEKNFVLIKLRKESLSNLEREFQELEHSLSKEKEQFNQESYTFVLEKMRLSETSLDRLQSQYIEIVSSMNSINKIKSDNLIKKERLFKIDICPTCLQDVPEAHKHNILNETESLISKINSQISELENERNKVSQLLEEEKSEKSLLEKQKANLDLIKSKSSYLERAHTKLLEIRESINQSKTGISSLEINIESLKQSLLAFSKFDNIIEQTQISLKEFIQKERNSEISLAELKKELELTNNEISLLEKQILEKSEKNSKLSRITELQVWLSSKFLSLIEFTERNVLMNLRIEFSKLFKKWFSLLVSSESLQVQLDDSFSPIIIQGETEMSYEFLSGGERTAVALAYRLALNQTINSILSKIQTRDIVILDEPTDGFSETQIHKMRDILSELNVSQLILVSHEQRMESFVENIIKIKKENDISTIELLNAEEKAPKNLNTPKISDE